MTAATVVVALVGGALIGLALGALGGGGSVLAVPVLVFGLGQSPAQATTGSLFVVGVTAVTGALTAHRAGNVLLGRGAAFGATAVLGAVAGARASSSVDGDVLLASFAALMLVIGAVMVRRQVQSRHDGPSPTLATRDDAPVLTLQPRVTCRCARALAVLGAATGGGLLTGFLGVGGGFLVVPTLLLTLGVPMRRAAGTSLVVIATTSAVALTVRAGSGIYPDWSVVLLLTAAATAAGVVGVRLAARVPARALSGAFTALVLVVAAFTATQALPALA